MPFIRPRAGSTREEECVPEARTDEEVMRAEAELFVDAEVIVDGKSSEGSWMVREEWILGGMTAVCIWSILRRRGSPQDIAIGLPLCTRWTNEGISI